MISFFWFYNIFSAFDSIKYDFRNINIFLNICNYLWSVIFARFLSIIFLVKDNKLILLRRYTKYNKIKNKNCYRKYICLVMWYVVTIEMVNLEQGPNKTTRIYYWIYQHSGLSKVTIFDHKRNKKGPMITGERGANNERNSNKERENSSFIRLFCGTGVCVLFSVFAF